MNIFYRPDVVANFYKRQPFMEFINLSEKRAEEIKMMVQHNYGYFAAHTSSLGGLMTSAANKLTTSARNFGLVGSDEILLFYIFLVDPDFLFLECYQCANKKEEVKPLCMNNLNIYDPFLIYYEVWFQRRFRKPELSDLWARGRIDTTCLFDKHGIAK